MLFKLERYMPGIVMHYSSRHPTPNHQKNFLQIYYPVIVCITSYSVSLQYKLQPEKDRWLKSFSGCLLHILFPSSTHKGSCFTQHCMISPHFRSVSPFDLGLSLPLSSLAIKSCRINVHCPLQDQKKLRPRVL